MMPTLAKNILIVDDIYTTGTTLDECARALKKAGASKVFVLCLARTPILKLQESEI